MCCSVFGKPTSLSGLRRLLIGHSYIGNGDLTDEVKGHNSTTTVHNNSSNFRWLHLSNVDVNVSGAIVTLKPKYRDFLVIDFLFRTPK